MTTKANDEARPDGGKLAAIEVTINKRAVVLDDSKVTGAEIKAAAIAQGVPIQADFVLFEVKGGRHLKQVGDQDRVTLQNGDQLQAVAPDDNS